MNTSQSKLQWIVEFINMKLADLNESELQKVRQKLSEFLIHMEETVLPGSIIAYALEPDPLKYSLKELLSLHSETKKIITTLVDSKRVQDIFYNAKSHPTWVNEGPEKWVNRELFRPENRPVLQPNPIDPVVTVTFSARLNSLAEDFQNNPLRFTRSNLHIRGKSRDVFLTKLLILISQEYLGKILRCPSQICKQTIFFATGKTLYCSPNCSKIMTQRRWRESVINRRTEALAAQKRRAIKKQSNSKRSSNLLKKTTKKPK